MAAVAQGSSVSRALSADAVPIALAAGPLRFVPATARRPAKPTKPSSSAPRCVPTRDNLHDFFNGLVWLRFPRAKRRLNELQAAEIARAGIGAARGPLRDALTLFDENGAVLDAPPPCGRRCGRATGSALFVTERALCGRGAPAGVRPCAAGKAGLAPQGAHRACAAGAPGAAEAIADRRWRPSRRRIDRPLSPPSPSLRCRCSASRAGGRRKPELFLL